MTFVVELVKKDYDDRLLDANSVIHRVAVDFAHIRDANMPVSGRRCEHQFSVRRPETLRRVVGVVLLREYSLVQVPYVVYVHSLRGCCQYFSRVQCIHVELRLLDTISAD